MQKIGGVGDKVSQVLMQKFRNSIIVWRRGISYKILHMHMQN